LSPHLTLTLTLTLTKVGVASSPHPSPHARALTPRPHPSPRALTPIPLTARPPQVSVDSGLVPGAEVTYYCGSVGKAMYKFWLLMVYLASHGEYVSKEVSELLSTVSTLRKLR